MIVEVRGLGDAAAEEVVEREDEAVRGKEASEAPSGDGAVLEDAVTGAEEEEEKAAGVIKERGVVEVEEKDEAPIVGEPVDEPIEVDGCDLNTRAGARKPGPNIEEEEEDEDEDDEEEDDEEEDDE